MFTLRDAPCHIAHHTASNAAEAFQHDVGLDVEELVVTDSISLIKYKEKGFMKNTAAFAMRGTERISNMCQQDG